LLADYCNVSFDFVSANMASVYSYFSVEGSYYYLSFPVFCYAIITQQLICRSIYLIIDEMVKRIFDDVGKMYSKCNSFDNPSKRISVTFSHSFKRLLLND